MKSQEFLCKFKDCNKVYCSQNNLKRHHESSHMGLKRFKCSMCKKYLSSKQSLLEHMFMHSGEKPFSCNYPDCTSTFRQCSQLSLHRKMHEEVTKRCLEIKKEFSTKVKFNLKVVTEGIIAAEKENSKDTSKNLLLPLISQPQLEVVLPTLPILNDSL